MSKEFRTVPGVIAEITQASGHALVDSLRKDMLTHLIDSEFRWISSCHTVSPA